MRIIVAVDEQPYSAQAVSEAARLARNTWPDVRLLAVSSAKAPKGAGSPGGDPHPLLPVLREHRRRFLAEFAGEDCPYPPAGQDYELHELGRGVWEERAPRRESRKDLRLKLRLGAPAKEVLAEAAQPVSDLIVIGCDQAQGCTWLGGDNLPQKMASEAPCSVLVVKGEKKIDQMVCCLDHDQVSQASLELINQMVTLYQARLHIVGLTEKDTLKAEVEKKMAGIVEYYTSRRITPWLELVEQQSLLNFVAQRARQGLVALWMGKKSIFRKVFSHGRVEQLVKASQSPVLILR